MAWKKVSLIILLFVIALVIYYFINMPINPPPTQPESVASDLWGKRLARLGNLVHQSFTINNLNIHHASPSAGGYGQVTYTLSSGEPYDLKYRENLDNILASSNCPFSRLDKFIAGVEARNSTTIEEIKNELACLGELKFTPVEFSED